MSESAAVFHSEGDDSAQATPLSLNEVWLRCIVNAVCEFGVRRVVLSGGARASLLCILFDADTRMVQRVNAVDERSGAFIALGMAKATSEPVAIVTTSGSAVGNLVPALIEAHACNLPLVVLSCDRPRHLRGAGFGQMCDHIGACRAFVRSQLDLPDPIDEPAAIARMREEVARTVAACVDGPVHLNLPLEGVFDSSEPSPVSVPTRDAAALRGAQPIRWDPQGRRKLGVGETPGQIVARVLARSSGGSGSLRGLIVAGPDPAVAPAAILELARTSGFPILADAASGVRAGLAGRRHDDALVVNGFDVVAQGSPLGKCRPELIIRLGLAPVSPPVLAYLSAHPAPTIKIARGACERDYLHPTLDPRDVLIAPSANDLAMLGDALIEQMTGGRPDAVEAGCVTREWRDAWAALAERGRSIRHAVVRALPWGEVVAAQEIFATRGFAFVHIGNSLPVRHADILYDNREDAQACYVSRGVSGIDGTLSTFCGEVLGRGDVGLLVIGDQAFLHDLPALSSAQRLTTPACVCVMHNRGGAIFDFLPISTAPGFERAIRNPYRIDFGALARGFGLNYAHARDRLSLRQALAAGRAHAGVTIVEVDVPAHSAVEQLDVLASTLQAQMR
ncbi:2-succinyl-5-enolpyruvyl-6-hydroxy-3-cyclohexene-1-carboxylate synthase [Paraburkholderia nemoris]|jgi:2-succinyl-5-enolpyruvyl-6-hydroxy-3-cyclohexene-1-carboxylic-acid synthase|uniref:2-succinyl-5-enolpyruvyl-6-hydroxy-3- cyclohexene-1-carboxylic-acid synthase n=1 Tax=Paraburkholderia nemoris TaxID=2793076 RepID=UPI001909F729|nr:MULTISPECIES: 2-succinyl-5-enolpyruvyl-6-hydroxy-3-cyclohexene-1-carboxylic-acid synthase [Paraburkholderia]MBK3784386.1 2-succinyl-5-enolpyruvyl-6-hydroxy-3-cyclohexene-1-carboxylic-acid synthase [Paraburkholderia aspalathi]CAE6758600.1 2-succinyl-5-enolpyruvyl-6-hydroxy-3-cyclohexene-1-carboxylate synthase [Paraburkholderia nemoris]CAE6809821.1 2-succinyl-5-enolpyruvyl-6-hydroxy-3-cyclohexene-1-carboxylate synthase [Paraburkholderia nemoris]